MKAINFVTVVVCIILCVVFIVTVVNYVSTKAAEDMREELMQEQKIIQERAALVSAPTEAPIPFCRDNTTPGSLCVIPRDAITGNITYDTFNNDNANLTIPKETTCALMYVGEGGGGLVSGEYKCGQGVP